MYTDCHVGNIVPCQWPVGHNEDFDFAAVDASGLLKLNSGKGGQGKARVNLDGLLGMHTQLQHPAHRDELASRVQKVHAPQYVFKRF